MKFVALILCLICFDAFAVADCVKETFKIKYDCGEGTLAEGATLPAEMAVAYGQTVTTSPIPIATCVPPSDEYRYGGQAIYQNGKQLSVSAMADQRFYQNPGTPAALTFQYLFVTDITIQPKWVKNPNADMVRAYFGSETRGYTSEMALSWIHDSSSVSEPGTWEIYYPWGWVSGESRCAGTIDQDWNNQNAPFYVPVQQDNITETYWGVFCYCRMVQPVESKWIFRFQSSSQGCDGNCEGTCADYFGTWGAVGMMANYELLFDDGISAAE